MSVATASDAGLSALDAKVRGISDAKGAQKKFNVISDRVMGASGKVQQNAVLDGLKRFKDTNPELVSTAVATLGSVGDVASKVKAVEQQLSRFAETSAVIMKGLDAVQQVHPFIGIAVMALKAAIQLELTRRENDKKVLVLKTQMLDMMDVLRNLKDVKDAARVESDGTTLQGRMQRVLEQAATDIRECSAVCEKYIHKKFIVKLFDGARWEGKLAGFGDVFTQRKDDFSFALSIHTAQGVDSLQRTMASSQDQLSMLLLFTQLESPQERELIQLIDEMGGPAACLKDNSAFAELQARMKALKGAADDADAETPDMVAAAVREAMNEDMEKALAKDRRAFDRKFDGIQETLEEMKNVVTRSSDRILSAIDSGPHDRIIDKDLYNVWKEMAWRGSVKARHFIVAVQDYFLQKYGSDDGSFLPQQVDNAHPAASEVPPSAVTVDVPNDALDKWAVKYLTLTRVRPILEAFDDDASGWISVREANAFTTNRPADYSVVKWLAFWAAGFRVVCVDYARKIDTLRVQMIASGTQALPCNRLLVDKYLRKAALNTVDRIARSVLAKQRYEHDDTDALERFQDYVQSEEARLQRGLDRFDTIDASNTLSMILGPGRLERHIFPLLYLLLKRHANILRLASQVRIDDQEFDDAEESLGTVVDALHDRLEALISNFRNQNLEPQQQFAYAYNKMYSAYYESYMGENVNAYEYERVVLKADDADTPSPDSLKYDHGPPSAPDHFYDSFIAEDAEIPDISSFNGLWTGRHYYGDVDEDCHDGTLVMRLELGADNQLTGHGKDAIGKFTFTGSATPIEGEGRSRLRVCFKTTHVYLSTFWFEKPAFRYAGTVDVDESGAFTRISGNWGDWEDDEKDFEPEGGFWLDRSSAIVARHRPSTEYSKSTAKARWKMLSRVVLEQVRRQRWSWTYFRMRRDDRVAAVEAQKRILVLDEPHWYLRQYPPAEDTPDFETIRQDVETRIPVEDIAFYRWLGQQRLRAETAHLYVACDGCGRTPIGARYICLNCKPADPVRGIDLCSDCTDKPVHAPAPPRQLEHVPTHDLLKTLRVLSLRELVRTLNLARIRLASAQARYPKADAKYPASAAKSVAADASIPVCCICEKEVSRPCWYCIECSGGVFLCESCEHKQLAMSTQNPKRTLAAESNEEAVSESDAKGAAETNPASTGDGGDAAASGDEEDDDSSYEPSDDTDTSSGSSTDDDDDDPSESESAGDQSEHFWWHVLVRVKAPADVPAPTKLELDARITMLEKQVEDHAVATKGKLENIEGLLSALDDKVDTGLEGRLEKLEASLKAQQASMDARLADKLTGVEALLQRLFVKL